MTSRESVRLARGDALGLSRYAACVLVGRVSDRPVPLSKLRPVGFAGDAPLRTAMQGATEYLASYVRELAAQDPGRAGKIAELLEVPVVRKFRGKYSYVVEKRTLASHLAQLNSAGVEGQGEAGKSAAQAPK